MADSRTTREIGCAAHGWNNPECRACAELQPRINVIGGSGTTPEECSVVTWPTAAMWDAWYSSIPTDIKRKLSLHDMKRIGDCFKSAFGVPDVAAIGATAHFEKIA